MSMLGKTFMTTRTTLSSEPNSMLSRMFLDTKEGQGADELQRIVPSVQDDQGAYMIDRSPKYFEPILNYLRTGKIIIDTNVSRDGGIYFKKLHIPKANPFLKRFLLSNLPT